MKLRSSIVVPFALLVLGGCRRDGGGSVNAGREPASVATTHSAELVVPQTGSAIETVDLETDRSALVVVGNGNKASQPIIHLHGMCTEAKSDLEAWASGVRQHGTIIALEGDKECTNGAAGRTWSMDVAALDRRIDAAIAGVRSVRGVNLDPKEIILVGESMGATRATALAARWPEKYPRIVLVGAPEKLQATSIEGVKAVAVLVGDKDAKAIPQQNYDTAVGAGKPAQMFTLTDAIHGEYGPEGATTMSEAVAFVTSK